MRVRGEGRGEREKKVAVNNLNLFLERTPSISALRAEETERDRDETTGVCLKRGTPPTTSVSLTPSSPSSSLRSLLPSKPTWVNCAAVP